MKEPGCLSAPAASLTVVTDHTQSTFQGPPLAGDETATLLGSLERQRATFAWKVGGLDAAGLQATVGVSTMTLGGLLKHLALVEDDYFSRRLAGGSWLPPGTPSTGTPTPTGSGARPPTTPPRSSTRSGRVPSPAPARR